MAQLRTSLFIFRRDLRIADNTGLLRASAASERVIPCFIVDPRQVGDTNAYRSLNAMQFMHQALVDLAKQVRTSGGRLYFFTGTAEYVVQKLLAHKIIDAVFVNRDYTAFSLKRDQAIEHACAARGIPFVSCPDALLHEPEEIMTGNGTPYSVFTPFFKKARSMNVREPEAARIKNWFTAPVPGASRTLANFMGTYQNKKVVVTGTHTQAQKILKDVRHQANYVRTHDYPSIATTHASAPLKFGLISIRQLYHALVRAFGPGHALVRQLYWRDFFTHVAYFSPFVFGQPFKEKYTQLAWHNDKKLFARWCNGQTGFPIIDAGMHELNQTGYLHNRVRLLVASFLVKDLHIDWRWGEKYFATKLVDYDPAINNGNWQWVASTGTDAQPYFRIFNPWLQQKKYDPQCLYIKKWLPPLKSLPAKHIHAWHTYAAKRTDIDYPAPCVDHTTESTRSKKHYRDIGT